MDYHKLVTCLEDQFGPTRYAGRIYFGTKISRPAQIRGSESAGENWRVPLASAFGTILNWDLEKGTLSPNEIEKPWNCLRASMVTAFGQ